MSVDYCHKHHNYYDTDFETECLQCVDEEVEAEEKDFKKWKDENYDYIRFGLYDDCGMRISNTELIQRFKND